MVSTLGAKRQELKGGRGCGSLFFIGFFLIGALLFFSMGYELYRVMETYSWRAEEASIVTMAVERKRKGQTDEYPYKLKAKYSYIVDGIPYTSQRINFGDVHFSSYKEAHRIARAYPEGSKRTIYVNPTVPHESILYHESISMLAVLAMIPLIFIVIGLGGLLVLWWPGRAARTESLTYKAGMSQRSGKSLRMLFLVLGLGSTAVSVFFLLQSLHDLKAAFSMESFRPVDCKILSTDIIRHVSTDDDGHSSVSYSPDVFYECTSGDTRYRSNEFQLFLYTGSSYQTVESQIEPFHVGETYRGWQNPLDEEQILLIKSYGKGIYLAAVPVISLLVGLALFTAAVSPSRKSAVEMVSKQDKGVQDGGGVLVSSQSRGGKLLSITFIMLFWNAIISIFIYQLYVSIIEENIDYFLGLFLIPFLIIGLVLIGAVIKEFLVLFNPVIRAEVSRLHPKLGERFELRWYVDGRATRLSNVTIFLEGEERATYRRGTETVVAENVFYRKKLTDDGYGKDLSKGSCMVRIPPDSMHSFKALNNEILWKITIRGEILRWPDALDTYTIGVRPHGSVDEHT